VRPAVRAALVVLAVGGIPGAALRSVVYDLPAPPVPEDVKDRDGVVLVAVRDGASGLPLAGARVRALAIVDGVAYSADQRETDAGGRVRLSKLARGELWILADAPGKARGSTHLVLEAEPRTIDIELGPEHAIDVIVKDDGGVPVAGADIEALEPGDPLPVGARTGSDGGAHVGRLRAGPWRVSARAVGYEEADGRAEHDGETVNLVARKLGALAVHVVRDVDTAAPGARVAVAGATLWPARSAETSDQGDVRIGGLAAGTYALRATQGDLVSPIELGVTLGRGEEKAVTLHLAPGRWVAVRVTDGDAEDAAPIASARVTLAEGGLSPFPLESTTDPKGRARLGPIAAGGATVGARADGFVSRGAVLVVDPPPPETRIALVRAGVLTGRVVDARGFPIDGATIEIVGTDPSGAPIFDDPRRATFQAAHFEAMLSGPAPLVPAGELGVTPGPVPGIPHQDVGLLVRAASSGGGVAAGGAAADRVAPAEPWVTRSDGTFRAAPASPGRIRAVVRHPQYVEAQSDLLSLAPGEEAHVDVVMHAGGSLEGRVLDNRDRPVEGARIVVSALRGSLERTTRTASDGTFAFAALPDAVSLTAGLDNSDEQPDVRMTLEVPEAGRKDVTIHLPEPRGGLAVSVLDERDRPIDAAQVTASSLAADAPLRTTAFTDARGSATLKRARGLPLRVEASAPGYAPRVVTTDGSGDALRVALSPAESATGEVVAARGRDAIPGADVTLYTDLGVRRTRTDAKGMFSLRDLASGRASLRVRAAGYTPASSSIAIPDSGGRRPFAIPRVELAVEGVVEGEVVDARGDPVAGARVARDHVPTWLVVGTNPQGVALSDAKGRFTLRELPEGNLALEAYAPDRGRARVEGVRVTSGRTTVRVRIALGAPLAEQAPAPESSATGSVAVTLGETGEPVEVVIVSLVEGSEAERAGLAPGDVLLAIDGASVATMGEARTRLSGPLADDVVLRVRRGDQTLALRVARESVRR
jgi:hypothetical protein